MIETEGLTHIHLFVADLDRSLRFYREVFGLEEMYRSGPKMVFLKPPNSNDTITLNEEPDKAGAAGGVDHFGFRLADKSQIDRAIEEADFPVLAECFGRDHVQEWWRDPSAPDMVTATYLPRVRGEVPTDVFVIVMEGRGRRARADG